MNEFQEKKKIELTRLGWQLTKSIAKNTDNSFYYYVNNSGTVMCCVSTHAVDYWLA